jgi:hypothetical protein
VDSETLGAINDGGGAYITIGSSTSGASGPDRLVTPGNGIWRVYDGSVRQGPPPAAVLDQLKLNLNPTVYSHLHELLFGNP